MLTDVVSWHLLTFENNKNDILPSLTLYPAGTGQCRPTGDRHPSREPPDPYLIFYAVMSECQDRNQGKNKYMGEMRNMNNSFSVYRNKK